MYQAALAGKATAIREVTKWIIKYQRRLADLAPETPPHRIDQLVSHNPDNTDEVLQILGIALPSPFRADIGQRARPTPARAAGRSGSPATQARRGGLTDNERNNIRRETRDPDGLRWPRER